VFSQRASIDIKKYVKEGKEIIPVIPEWDDSGALSTDEKILISHSIKEVKQTMWDYVGIVRSNRRLERAARRIHNIFVETEELYKKTKVFEDILELRNIVACAHMIIKSAKLRKESRGLHYNLDYLKQLPRNKIKDTILQNLNP